MTDSNTKNRGDGFAFQDQLAFMSKYCTLSHRTPTFRHTILLTKFTTLVDKQNLNKADSEYKPVN